MILKIENVGSVSQSDKQERFTAYLVDKLKPKDSAEFELMISSFTEKELKELYKQFEAMEGSLFAKMGAKLDYLTRLNGKCPEGYEIDKFLIGGCVKCKKKHALLFEFGGNTKKRFSQKPDKLKCGKKVKKHKCGSAFKKVNGGPGSVDSTRDMKPNKKQRKMIKKHLGGTTEGGVTFREDLNPPTQGIIGELRRNIEQGTEQIGNMLGSVPMQILIGGATAGTAGIVGPTVRIGKDIRNALNSGQGFRLAMRKVSRNLNAKKGDPSYRWTKTSGDIRKGGYIDRRYTGISRAGDTRLYNSTRSEGSGYGALHVLNENPVYQRASSNGQTAILRSWNNANSRPVEQNISNQAVRRNELIDRARDWRNWIFE